MRKFTAIFLILFSVISCKTNKDATSVNDKKVSISEVKDGQFKSLFIEANKQKMLENYEKAIKTFEKCKTLRPNNGATLFELSKLYQAKGDVFLAIGEVEKAVKTNQKNKWYLLQLARLQQKSNQHKKAIKTYEKIIVLDPKNKSALIELLSSCEVENEFEKAGETLKHLEKISGKSPQISYQKYLFFRQANKTKKAVESLEEIIELDPKNGVANLELAKYHQNLGKGNLAFEELKLALADKRLPSDTKLGILMDYTRNASRSMEIKLQTEELLKIMAETHPKNVKSYVAYGDFYNTFDQLEKSRSNYLKATEFAKNSFPIFTQIMDLDTRLNNNIYLEKDAEKALENYPTQPMFYLYKGIAENGLKKYRKAISTFNSGKSILIDNEELLFEFYSNLGSTYNNLKEYKKSDEAYDNAMEINGLQPYLLNNYSYYLSLRNEKLEKAQEMSKKANELVPNNASFNDTYGWIFFQQGKYTDAEIWINKALQNGGDKSGTVLEHYGDIMSKLNKVEKAMEYWLKAKKNGEVSDKIDLKIKDKKYHE